MSTTVTVNGQNYSVPEVGEEAWGDNVSQLLIALSVATPGNQGIVNIVTVATTPVTVTSGRTYLVNTSAARTLQLPAPALNAFFFVRDTSGLSATNNITIQRFGSEQINGVASNKTLSINNGAWMFVCDGTNWWTNISIEPALTALTGDVVATGPGSASATIQANAITTSKILDANITGVKIADGAVTTAKIADVNVTTAKIADSAITTQKISDANVTPAKLSFGTVIQSVYSQTGAVATGTTTIPFDDTVPQNTEGTEFLSVSITPSSSTNILLIEVAPNFSSSGSTNCGIAVFQDSTASAIAAVNQIVSSGGYMVAPIVRHTMLAGTTSSTTFKVRIGPDTAATITLNGTGGARRYGGVCASSIRVTEFKP